MSEKHDGKSLQEYIRSLLLDGKGSKHEDFQLLFKVFGKEKIVKIALEEKAKDKVEDENEQNLL